MLFWVTLSVDPATRRAILDSSIVIFVFRATPSVGDGYFWWTLDVPKFDEAFYGVLRQTSAIIAIVAMWALSKQLTDYSISKVLLWLTIAGTVLSLPNIGLFYGVHEWTGTHLGFGARTIALVDAAAASPFAQLSMIPLLSLIAFYAPANQRATWFALMASLMNLALVAGQLQTRYLNQIFRGERGDYADLGPLLVGVALMGLLLPVAAIAIFGRRILIRVGLRHAMAVAHGAAWAVRHGRQFIGLPAFLPWQARTGIRRERVFPRTWLRRRIESRPRSI